MGQSYIRGRGAVRVWRMLFGAPQGGPGRTRVRKGGLTNDFKAPHLSRRLTFFDDFLVDVAFPALADGLQEPQHFALVAFDDRAARGHRAGYAPSR